MTVTELAAFENREPEFGRAPFGEVRALPSIRPEAPELPSELIPAPLRPWICDLCDRMQVPLEFAAVPALVAFAGVLGRRVAVHPKAQDDWLVVPNLWGAIVARPGKMKSPVMAATLRPVRELELDAHLAHQESLDTLGAHLDSLRANEAAIKQQLKRTHEGKGEETVEELEENLVELKREIRETERDSQPQRFVVNDTTVEKLGELLRANPQGLLLERDELAGLLRSLDRDDRRGDREFYLEAWNGTNSFTCDRIGRGTIRVPCICLSIIGGIQPSKLNKYVSEALQGGYAADGLLQRFQLLVWPEDDQPWNLIDRKPNEEAYRAVSAVLCQLKELPVPEAGDAPPALRFSPDAQTLFNEWLTELEHRIRSKELSAAPAFESHLSKYRSLMPSLALIFHLIESPTLGSPIPLHSAQAAADWCEYLEQHARKLYAPELQDGLVAAHALAQKIRSKTIVSGMSTREIYSSGWSDLKTADAVSSGMEVLSKHGWARIESVRSGRGRPSLLVAVNPEVVP